MTDSRRDSERTRRRILAEATAEFAERGFAGARVDHIAARTITTKRMIYYYFGSKEGLFVAVLESLLSGAEVAPADAPADPVCAIRWLIRQTLDDDERHPERARLLATANLHHSRHLTGAAQASRSHRALIGWLSDVLERGVQQHVFREQVDPADLLTVVQAVSTYRLTHQSSAWILDELDLLCPDVRQRQEDLLSDMVLAYLAPEQP